MKIEKFEDIVSWQLGRILVVGTYKRFSTCRDYAFRDQIQRASLSIMNNVAEGFGRKGDKELTRYLKIAKGSCMEVRSMSYAAKDLKYLADNDAVHLFDLTVRIEQSLLRFIQAIDG